MVKSYIINIYEFTNLQMAPNRAPKALLDTDLRRKFRWIHMPTFSNIFETLSS
jgi:hypothetical protein